MYRYKWEAFSADFFFHRLIKNIIENEIWVCKYSRIFLSVRKVFVWLKVKIICKANNYIVYRKYLVLKTYAEYM